MLDKKCYKNNQGKRGKEAIFQTEQLEKEAEGVTSESRYKEVKEGNVLLSGGSKPV